MSVQLSTSRLRTAPGMGNHTGCFVCGKHGHWSKDCPVARNGSHSDGMRGRGAQAPPHGLPSYGSYGMASPAAADYMSGSAYSPASYVGGLPPPLPHRLSGYASEPGDRYSSRAPGSYADRSPAFDRDHFYSSINYYEKYRAHPFGSSYFEDRRMSYLPPPPPSSISKLSSSVDPFERQALPPPQAPAACYTGEHTPTRRAAVPSAGFAYERTQLSPASASRSSYTAARPKGHYASRYVPY